MSTVFHIAGVRRSVLYSPNQVDNDAAIFDAVVNNLLELGHEVRIYDEQALVNGEVSEKYIFNMVRSDEAIAKLQELEKLGVVAVNSGFGIENCAREQMTSLLLQHEVPYPQSVICDVDAPLPSDLKMPCWVKRSDHHAIYQDDVSFVRDNNELKQVLASFSLRGINRVVINEHLTGDLIKFYGVTGTDFFYWFYPYDNHSKFGLESINGAPQGIDFSDDELIRITNKAASVLSVVAYGGDAIITADGSIHIIDFNDWPSFAPCRMEGAKAIAEAIIQRIERTEL